MGFFFPLYSICQILLNYNCQSEDKLTYTQYFIISFSKEKSCSNSCMETHGKKFSFSALFSKSRIISCQTGDFFGRWQGLSCHIWFLGEDRHSPKTVTTNESISTFGMHTKDTTKSAGGGRYRHS